eukprot:TRINITY_DN4091_c0_g1_i5.p1 TRINITY_DN4091_c0_g1~~TRINITY_DN4091_c0_g1_i5.p1  ORF type:complete len:125 (-),score=25.58 TRINITY_DN4091_c0_g1_i5:651-1025(-)
MKTSTQSSSKRPQKNVHFDLEESNPESEPKPSALRLIRPTLSPDESEDSASEDEGDSLPDVRIEETSEQGNVRKGVYQARIELLQQELRELKTAGRPKILINRELREIKTVRGILKRNSDASAE